MIETERIKVDERKGEKVVRLNGFYIVCFNSTKPDTFDRILFPHICACIAFNGNIFIITSSNSNSSSSSPSVNRTKYDVDPLTILFAHFRLYIPYIHICTCPYNQSYSNQVKAKIFRRCCYCGVKCSRHWIVLMLDINVNALNVRQNFTKYKIKINILIGLVCVCFVRACMHLYLAGIRTIIRWIAFTKYIYNIRCVFVRLDFDLWNARGSHTTTNRLWPNLFQWDDFIDKQAFHYGYCWWTVNSI